MARKKKQQAPQVGAPLFMATYGDMVTLLLCFFVLLYSFSTLDVRKFEMIAASLQMAFSIQPGGHASTAPISMEDSSMLQSQGTAPVQSASEGRAIVSRQILAMVREVIKNEHLEDEIQIEENERGVSISMSEQLLFSESSAALYPEAARILYKIGEILKDIPNHISAEGHTDNIRPSGTSFRNNWNLSAARAAAVTAYLHGTIGINENRLQAVGMGSSRPVVPNDSPEHRSLNRRVDLVILSEYSIR